MTEELREMIDARKRELAATWVDPKVRYGGGPVDVARRPVVEVPASAELKTPEAPVRVRKTRIRGEMAHGLSRYTHRGCKCDVCLEALRVYCRNRTAAKRARREANGEKIRALEKARALKRKP